jgi:hypothetical protein
VAVLGDAIVKIELAEELLARCWDCARRLVVACVWKECACGVASSWTSFAVEIVVK